MAANHCCFGKDPGVSVNVERLTTPNLWESESETSGAKTSESSLKSEVLVVEKDVEDGKGKSKNFRPVSKKLSGRIGKLLAQKQ